MEDSDYWFEGMTHEVSGGESVVGKSAKESDILEMLLQLEEVLNLRGRVSGSRKKKKKEIFRFSRKGR